MQKLFLSLVFIISSSLFSMSKEDLNDQLLLEIKSKKIKYDKIKNLIAKGANPNIEIEYVPAIAYCFERDLLQLFELLIENGADINGKFYNYRRNFAMTYIRKIFCNFKTNYPLDYLIEKGLDINAVDENGYNLLHILLKESRFWDCWNHTKRCKDLVSFLIYKGIDVRKRSNTTSCFAGITPVTLAASHSQEVIDIFSDYDSFISNATSLDTADADSKSKGQLYEQYQEKLKKEKKSECIIL